jgi:predicted RNA-binding Zn ribbon-like protein
MQTISFTKPPLAPQLGNVRGEIASWHGAESVEMVLAYVARDAADLLSGPWSERIRVCANPECATVFVDESRPGQRRWRAMNTCGNHAKKNALKRKKSRISR